jgi:nicotinate-nucleotide adenylyltransferase
MVTKSDERRIGLFGGTFDPIHLGHLLAAQEAHERLGLARLILMPACRRPHKDRPVATSPADRLQMLRLAVADDARFEVSDLEIRRGGQSYTIDTVTALRRSETSEGIRAAAAREIVLLVGSDSVPELPAWHRIGELADLCTLVVMARPGFSTGDLQPLRRALSQEQVARIAANLLPIPLIEISSTEVRARVAAGRSIRYLVPAPVAGYIAERGLYRT